MAEAVTDAVPGEVAGCEEPGVPAVDTEPGEVPPPEGAGPEAAPEEIGALLDATILDAAEVVPVGAF
jgi:hypothetical protein